MIFSLMMVIILCLLAFVQLVLTKNMTVKDLNLSPLESGFESLKSSSTLSAPFFFLAILFVLFDLELIILFPGVLNNNFSSEVIIQWSMVIILILITLLLEWSWCGLKWQV